MHPTEDCGHKPRSTVSSETLDALSACTRWISLAVEACLFWVCVLAAFPFRIMPAGIVVEQGKIQTIAA